MDPLVQIVISTGTVIALFALGLTLDLAGLTRVVTRPSGFLLGLAVSWLLLPALALGLCALLRPPPPIALGTIVIAACPVGTPAALFARVGRGDATLALALAAVTSLASAVTMPLAVHLADLLLGSGAEAPLHLGRTVLALTAVATLPTAAGMALRRARPSLAAASEPRVTPFLSALLLVVFVAAVVGLRGRIVPSLADAGLLALGLNLSAAAMIWPLTRAARLAHGQALAVALAGGLRNFGLAAFVSLTLIGDPRVLLPGIAYGLIMWASAAAALRRGRRATGGAAA